MYTYNTCLTSRALPRHFICFVIAYLTWNRNTLLVVPDIAIITTNHPFAFFWHSTFAMDINTDTQNSTLLYPYIKYRFRHHVGTLLINTHIHKTDATYDGLAWTVIFVDYVHMSMLTQHKGQRSF